MAPMGSAEANVNAKRMTPVLAATRTGLAIAANAVQNVRTSGLGQSKKTFFAPISLKVGEKMY